MVICFFNVNKCSRVVKLLKELDLRKIKEEFSEKFTHVKISTCSKSANKPSTSCVRTACFKLSTSFEQAVNNLEQPC